MTKKELAARLGKKYTTYCRMEKDAKRITNSEVEEIAKILGADKDYILYGEKQQYDFTPLDPKTISVESPNRGVSPFEKVEQPIIKYSHGDFDCSSEEKALVLIYRNLSDDKKRQIRTLIDDLNK